MASDRYDSSPALLDVPLGIDDLEALIAGGGRGLAGDKRSLLHFLRRVLVTLKASRQQIQRLHQDVRRAGLVKESAGTATTLDPMDAARFLTPGQREMLFEGSMRERLAAIDRAYKEVNELRKNLHRDVGRVNFLFSGLRDDPSLPPEIRAKAASALTQLPADPGPGAIPVPDGVKGASSALSPPRPQAPSAPPAGAYVSPASLPAPTGAPVLGADVGPQYPAGAPEPNAAAAGAPDHPEASTAQQQVGAEPAKPDEAQDKPADPFSGLFG